MLQGARSADGLPPPLRQLPEPAMLFSQIPNLPARPVGFLRADAPGSERDRSWRALGEKETGWRGDNVSPPRYDPLGSVPGRAADEGSQRTKSSAKQSHSNFHGAILSLTSSLDSPGPEG